MKFCDFVVYIKRVMFYSIAVHEILLAHVQIS